MSTTQSNDIFTEDDLNTLLAELGADDAAPHDNIDDDPHVDHDLTIGTSEIDDAFDSLINDVLADPVLEPSVWLLPADAPEEEPVDERVAAVADPTILGGAKVKDPVAAKTPSQAEGSIDERITAGDMLALIHAEAKTKGIGGHHISSMNSFYTVGIKQIVTKVFAVEGRLKNLRDKHEEDREIADITYRVDFTDINLTPPTTVKYKSGSVQMLTPAMARVRNLTYSGQMYMDAQITATAFFKNGTTKTRTAAIKDHRIASMPCLLGTSLCNTYNCSTETLKQLEEDPRGLGGVFIIGGNEWAIDNLENISNNTFHVYKNMFGNEIARGTFLSKPGDAFENSYQVILRYLNSGAITMELTTNKFDKLELPYYLIFRALGMTADLDIVSHIVYDVEAEDVATRQMMEILEKTFELPDSKFDAIRKSTVPADIIAFIAQRITDNANTSAARKDDNIAKYLNNNILNIIDRFIFPHIGTGIEHRIKKLRFFGHLINKLLRVEMGVLEQTDRDSYKNKRVFAAGTSMAKAFKTDFNFAVVQEIRKHLAKDFKSTPFSHVQLAESVKAAINSDDLERMLTQAITSGNKTITVKKNEITNRVASQTLYHKNDLNYKSTLNTISTPNTSASKQNERADVMRRVHPTYHGFLDVSQSADTGEKVGMTKQLGASASVCGASSSFVLKDILSRDPEILALDSVEPVQMAREKMAKVFINGDWIGCCRKSHEIVRQYRVRRREGAIHPLTTVVWDIITSEVHFWTDVGRLMRPLVIVYNNLDAYIDNWQHGDRTMKFNQWITLKREHIVGLQTGALTMEDLRAEQVIEYISPEEQENAYLAPNIDALRERLHNLRYMYTHCDIDQAIFGIVTLASPMANHSSATRITYYTNHRKQSAGWFVLNYPFRIDKNVTLQHYCEYPIVSAFSDSLTYPNGQNTIVALMLYKGENQEDSIKANQSSIDCGLFNASHYNYEKAELDKGEQFGNPDYARTMDIKKDATYEHIKNGFVAVGTAVKKGTVIIVKAAKIPKPADQFLFVDKSVVYKREEEVRVINVVTTRNNDDALITKVQTRADRPLAVGDKMSSRTGNKGICASKVPRCDMPYTEDGMTPDLIVNAHSIPTRMAVNQITECLLAQLAVRLGTHIDATSFRKHDFDGAMRVLEEHGIKYGGTRRMYNGMTGEWIDTLIFIGITTYQRLQKFVVDEHYATRTGPTSALTHQPLDGKNNDGGLRLGEMEKDVLCAHGTMRTLFEKFYKDSDGITLPICRNCGNRAVVNEKMGIYKCKECGDTADIANVASSWVANLFMSESSAMGVKLTFGLADHMFAEQAQ
jgi:DNA-directed RNA polymerase II subunit RPB2